MLSPRFCRQLTNTLLHNHPLRHRCLFCGCSVLRRRLPPSPAFPIPPQERLSSSSTRWRSRQTRDRFAREAKVQGLKSRAAFKLVEMNEKYRLFKPGITVIDLGYAPGSWSQIAVNCTQPDGRVVGIDVIPAQPPRGVSTIQGNFLSPAVRAEVRAYVQDPMRGRPRRRTIVSASNPGLEAEEGFGGEEPEELGKGYVDMERHSSLEAATGADRKGTTGDRSGAGSAGHADVKEAKLTLRERDEKRGWTVDVVLSDMSAPWKQTSGFHKKSLSNPYLRMMNTSGIAFRDHAGSMDLCMAALTFCFDTLRTGGHFVCKFYQGSEDRALEKKLRKLFDKVYREKPESSRSESKEAYFVALGRKEAPGQEDVFAG